MKASFTFPQELPWTIQPYNFQSNLICYNGPFKGVWRKIKIM
jgi:hypothetical protein